MSSFDLHLARSQLLDCQGRVTHTFVLLPDGRVRVRTHAGLEAVVDPVHRIVSPPSVHFHDDVFEHAALLARELWR